MNDDFAIFPAKLEWIVKFIFGVGSKLTSHRYGFKWFRGSGKFRLTSSLDKADVEVLLYFIYMQVSELFELKMNPDIYVY